MAKRPLRIQCLDDVFIVSNRTFQNEPLLPDDPLWASRIRGAMSYFALRYNISFFAYTFLANGYWMIVRAPDANLSSFMRDFQSWLGKTCNTESCREGDFFHDRFQDEAIVDAAGMVDAMIDVLVAPVREGFVEELDDFQGGSSWQALRDGRTRVGEWIDRARLYSLRRSNPDLPEKAAAVEYRMVLSSLGGGTDERDSAAWLREQVEARVAEIQEWRDDHADEPNVLWREKPHPRPWNASKVEPIGPPRYFYRYLCRGGEEKRRAAYVELRKDLRGEYTDAMALWRQGKDEWCSNGVCVVKTKRLVDRERGRLAEVSARSARAAHTPGPTGRRRTDPRPDEEIDFPTSSYPPGWVRPRRPLRPGLLGPPPDPSQNAA